MKFYKIVLTSVLSFLFSTINAQIVNGSFETVSIQPVVCDYSNAYLPSPWTMRTSCDHYVQGSTQSNSCSVHSGIGAGGFAATAANGNPSTPYREYIIQAMNLTGGIQYRIEFWLKRTAGSTNIKIGGHINTVNYAGCSTGVACPGLSIFNPTVYRVITGNNNQWTKVIGCYTPSLSNTYYLTIGNFSLTSSAEGSELNYFNLDDVSVTPITNIGNPNSILTINANAFCNGQQVNVDGSSSTNTEWHQWELWSQGGTTLLKKGSLIDGSPSTLNVNGFYSLQTGNCYRLKLVTYEECVQDEAFVDFCIEDPNVQLTLTGTNPYCEGTSLNLTTTGDNGWTYTWSTGQSGVGLKNITTTTNVATTQYSVTVTTSAGCTATQTIPVTVHPNNNIAPTINGINNTGDYTFYARAGAGSFSFSIPSFDATNEEVKMIANGIPIAATFSVAGLPHKTGTFTWTNPTLADIGIHTFNITVTDENACNPLSTTYTITINILCDFCPLEIHYQDRHANVKPLPPITEAGRKIRAGLNVDNSQPSGTVETGTASVLFEAPKIDLEPGFTGGINFTAQINPNTCTSSCQDCCSNFSGFTLDIPIGNWFAPNGDGSHDLWQITDNDHPYCAYNAKEFYLTIKSPSGNTIYKQSRSSPYCCQFQSVFVNNAVWSSIHWDGIVNQGPFSGNAAPDGAYFYILQLVNCGQTQTYASFIQLFNSQARLSPDTNMINELMLSKNDSTINSLKTNADFNNTNLIADKLIVYPNPTENKLSVAIISNTIVTNGKLEIYTLQGKLVWSKKTTSQSLTIDVNHFVPGTYFVKWATPDKIYKQIFIKN